MLRAVNELDWERLGFSLTVLMSTVRESYAAHLSQGIGDQNVSVQSEACSQSISMATREIGDS